MLVASINPSPGRYFNDPDAPVTSSPAEIQRYLSKIHGRGCAVFDVHGDLLKNIINHIPPERIKDVIHLDMANPYMNYRYNPLQKVSNEKKSLIVGGLLDAFYKLWKGAWGVRLEHILRYILLTLLKQPTSNLSDIPRIIHDIQFRGKYFKNIENNVYNHAVDKDISTLRVEVLNATVFFGIMHMSG